MPDPVTAPNPRKPSMSRAATRRQRQVREQITIANAVADELRGAAQVVLSLRRRARWATVAWGIVGVQSVLLIPSLIMFARLWRACGGPFRAVATVHWFVLNAVGGG